MFNVPYLCPIPYTVTTSTIKGTKTLLGREMIIRQRRGCHGDQVKGHHDWHTLKCVTAYHFNNYSLLSTSVM